ncbi:MAG: cytochrome C oxidase subunit IV family protein [Phycisphaerae bacterium]|jgi:cytochrome c oxidase subunit 4
MSLRTYYVVFGALLALTALTTAAAYVHVGGIGPLPADAIHLAIALSIAAVKATLVGLYFMHIRHAGGLTRLFAIAAIGWLVILMALTFADIARR